MKYDPDMGLSQNHNEIIVFHKVPQNQTVDDGSQEEFSSLQMGSTRKKYGKNTRKNQLERLLMKKKIAVGGALVLGFMIMVLLAVIYGKSQVALKRSDGDIGKESTNKDGVKNEGKEKNRPQSILSQSTPQENQKQSQDLKPAQQPSHPQLPQINSTPVPPKKIEKIVRSINAVYVDANHVPTSSHKHVLAFDFPTVGVPIPGKAFNDTLVKRQDLAAFDAEINELFKPYNDTDCEYARYGDGTYKGSVICRNFFDGASALVNIGISGVDDFGCEVTSKHPMPNYQYDCINPQGPVCQTNNDFNQFINVCVGSISEKTGKHLFYSYPDILKSHELEGKKVILRMNNQGGEYEGLKYVPVDVLEKVDMLLIEFHFQSIHPEEWGLLDIARTLAGKFVSVNYHFSNWSCFVGEEAGWRRMKAKAVEVTLINKRLIKLRSESRSFHTHSLNQKGRQDWSDCQMDS